VAAYPRPGAVWTHLVLQFIKDLQAKNNIGTVESKDLISFLSDFWNTVPLRME
jgi:hypothetical protein